MTDTNPTTFVALAGAFNERVANAQETVFQPAILKAEELRTERTALIASAGAHGIKKGAAERMVVRVAVE